MDDRSLLKTGLVGTLLAGICCTTPLLGLLLGGLGLSTWLAWLDFILLPALTFFLTLAIYAGLCLLRTRALRRAPEK